MASRAAVECARLCAVLCARFLCLASLASLALLPGCVVVPRTVDVYDAHCRVMAREMTLEVAQIGGFVGCVNEGCAALLVAAGVVTGASAVVSGSIVIAGNFVYWLEKRGRCEKEPRPVMLPADPAGGAM